MLLKSWASPILVHSLVGIESAHCLDSLVLGNIYLQELGLSGTRLVNSIEDN